ncbi:MAG: ribosome maturation factor RimM [Acidobacteriota bacterium]
MVLVGTFRRPHGLGGEIALSRLSDAHELPYGRLFAAGRELAIQSARRHGRQWLVKLRGIDSREEAAKLTGLEASVPREDLPALASGEHYMCDLPGIGVFDRSGTRIGTVQAIVAYGEADFVELEGGALIPLRAPFVEAIEPEQRRMIVSLPEGMLDIEGASP